MSNDGICTSQMRKLRIRMVTHMFNKDRVAELSSELSNLGIFPFFL